MPKDNWTEYESIMKIKELLPKQIDCDGEEIHTLSGEIKSKSNVGDEYEDDVRGRSNFGESPGIQCNQQ